MNIFFLHSDPRAIPRDMVDRHVVKMILESAQMLSTAHYVLRGGVYCDSLYKKTHINHPCSLWVRSSPRHYEWLLGHLQALLDEYTHRYEKRHKTHDMLDSLGWSPWDGYTNDGDVASGDINPPPLAMPDSYKQADHIEAYREYYLLEKIINKGLGSWTNRDVPEWVQARREKLQCQHMSIDVRSVNMNSKSIIQWRKENCRCNHPAPRVGKPVGWIS